MEPTIIRYPIPGNEIGGLLHIYGDRNASNVILYCGGWPDSVEPFTPLAQRLATFKGDVDDGCFVGITCWPGFDYESFQQTKFRGFKREGFSFDEVTCCIREAATQLFAEYNKSIDGDNNPSNGAQKNPTEYNKPIDDGSSPNNDENKKHQFTVIFHDWGVMTGLMFVNRSIEETYFTEYKPNRVVLLDVLNGPHRKFNRPIQNIIPYTRGETLVYLAYRGTFACSFAIQRYMSATIGLIVYGMLNNLVTMFRLQPLRRIDTKLLAERRMNLHHMVYTFYPYFYLFQALMYNNRVLAHASLPCDLSQTPILYMYGTDKNVMFHDHRSLAILEREEAEGSSDCRVVKVDGAGHWMYCQRPDVCEHEIRKFLKSNNSLGDKVDHEMVNLQSKL